MLDDGQDLGAPDAILINGRAPYRYDSALVPDGLPYEIVGVEPGHIWFFLSNFYLQICSLPVDLYLYLNICNNRRNISLPRPQRWRLNKPQLQDPEPQHASGGDRRDLHQPAELHRPGHPRGTVLLFLGHHGSEREHRLLHCGEPEVRRQSSMARSGWCGRPSVLQLQG